MSILPDATHYVARASAIPTFTVAALLLGLGALTLERERGSPEARAFFWLTLAAGAWMLGVSWMYLSADEATARLWLRVAGAGALLIAPATYGLAVRVAGTGERRRLAVGAAWACFALGAAAFAGTDAFVVSIRMHAFGPYPVFGQRSAMLAGPFAALLLASLVELGAAWSRAQPGTARLRARAFLFAFLVGDLAVVDFLPAFGVPVLPVGFWALAGFVVLAAAAIWRYGLADFAPAEAAEEVLRATADLVVLCDRQGRIRRANPALCAFAGAEPGELEGRPVEDLAATGSSRMALGAALESGRVAAEELTLTGKEGESVPVSVSASELHDRRGFRIGTAILARDVRFERGVQAELARTAFYDETTGLANRALLLDRIRLAASRARRSGSQFAVLCVQLDGLDRIVEGLGRAAGDDLLRRVGARLSVAVRDADSVARSGEEQFAVLLPAADDAHQAVEVAHRIEAGLEPPLALDGRSVVPSAWIGIAVSTTERRDPDEVLRDAQAAASRARAGGRRRIRLYAPEMRRDAASSLELEADLRRAFQDEQLLLHYQPIVRLADLAPTAFEALLRWRHPGRGLLEPEEFLEAARSSRLLPAIGRWVIHEACRQLSEWHIRFPSTREFAVHVDLSAEELAHPDLLPRIEGALAEHNLRARSLVLEVTESTLLHETEDAIGIIDALRARGLRLCADGFGTGYASLSYLGQFPLDILKIDASFVRSAPARSDSASILRAVLDLSRSLGMVAVAEGIETSAQLTQLHEGGCGLGQGSLFGPPRPAEDITRSLIRGEALVERPTAQSAK